MIRAQGLSAMLSSYEKSNLFKGIPIARGRFSISHLFFANDSLVFFKAAKEWCVAVKKCLTSYERASGQMINFDKSAITFSPSTSTEDANTIRHLLNIQVVQGHAIYLGLPTFSIRHKRIQFGYIRAKVQRKLFVWKNQTFSAGEKKSYSKQWSPSFAMSCFRLPRATVILIECVQVFGGEMLMSTRKCIGWNWIKCVDPKNEVGWALGHQQF